MPVLQSNRRLILALTAWATLSFPNAASAADPGSGPPPPPPPQWTVKFTPYAWASYLTGDTTVKGRTADIDVTPIELFEHLDAVPWMSYVEARRGPLAFYNDIVYAKLGVDVSGARSLGGLTLDAALGLDLSLTIIEVGGTYEVAKWWSGGAKDQTFARYTAIDLLAGARYWRQEADLRLALTATLNTSGLAISGSRAIAGSGGVDWVDPVVGARVRHQLAPGQELGCAAISAASTWQQVLVEPARCLQLADRRSRRPQLLRHPRVSAVERGLCAGFRRQQVRIRRPAAWTGHGPDCGLLKVARGGETQPAALYLAAASRIDARGPRTSQAPAGMKA